MMKELRIKNILTGLFTSALCFGLSMASYPDSVNVASRSSGLQGCRATTTSVRFRTLTMRGPKSMVTYRRFPITASDLAWVTNASQVITATDVVQCARKSALADMTAFAFDGACTTYKFNSKPSSCLVGEKVIYLANSSISYGPPATVPFGTAPYIKTTVENIEFKQYQLVNFFSDLFSNSALMQPFESEGGNIAVHSGALDVASCVTDTPCGLPVLVNTTRLTYYILNECGNTIQLAENTEILVFSHPGFGCKAFPDGHTYNCSVTFTAAKLREYQSAGLFAGADGSCDGYTMSAQKNSNENLDLCKPLKPGSFYNITIAIRGTVAAKTFKAGFFIFTL
ncbi:uncharacterized protein LOC108666627 isoform X2 [Hyalella azteca]|uniref:Uncharacterized protein LOC108666627 isoform X2 n=1 Tax=Hyalella azteca TaxID=294128 RepID=A0A979FJ01_HYAAZ|nr:uncharacterized protein LOC108666627 isoform X2 [Hyalella azteca]